MNYGKQNLEQRKKKISSKKNMKKKRVGVRFFKAMIICILILAVAGVGAVGLFAKKIINDSPTVTPAQVKPQGFTSFVYAEARHPLETFVEPVRTVSINPLTKFPNIWAMHLYPLRTSVFISTPESTFRVSCVQVSRDLPREASMKAQVP